MVSSVAIWSRDVLIRGHFKRTNVWTMVWNLVWARDAQNYEQGFEIVTRDSFDHNSKKHEVSRAHQSSQRLLRSGMVRSETALVDNGLNRGHFCLASQLELT